MAKLNKLITYAYLREECDIDTNIDDKELEHKIYRAQEMLRMLMGDEFYQDFLTNYKNNTLSAAYTSLYPYIKQFVAWAAHENWIIKANFKITRSGIRVHEEENSVAASDIQMSNLIKDAKYQTQYYKNLMIGYLDGNSSNYPLYSAYCQEGTTGNSFHISAVKNKHGESCGCTRCRCH
jgi:hypothetical protein